MPGFKVIYHFQLGFERAVSIFGPPLMGRFDYGTENVRIIHWMVTRRCYIAQPSYSFRLANACTASYSWTLNPLHSSGEKGEADVTRRVNSM